MINNTKHRFYTTIITTIFTIIVLSIIFYLYKDKIDTHIYLNTKIIGSHNNDLDLPIITPHTILDEAQNTNTKEIAEQIRSFIIAKNPKKAKDYTDFPIILKSIGNKYALIGRQRTIKQDIILVNLKTGYIETLTDNYYKTTQNGVIFINEKNIKYYTPDNDKTQIIKGSELTKKGETYHSGGDTGIMAEATLTDDHINISIFNENDIKKSNPNTSTQYREIRKQIFTFDK